MPIVTTFVCDKCGKSYPYDVRGDIKWPITINIRLSRGYREDTQYGGYGAGQTWCPACCEKHGIEITKTDFKNQPQAGNETIEDKIVYFLEELGFKRDQ